MAQRCGSIAIKRISSISQTPKLIHDSRIGPKPTLHRKAQLRTAGPGVATAGGSAGGGVDEKVPGVQLDLHLVAGLDQRLSHLPHLHGAPVREAQAQHVLRTGQAVSAFLAGESEARDENEPTMRNVASA